MIVGNKDIQNIIAGSELRDMADFLTNPASSITDCVICYQSNNEVGYQILGGSGIATLIGLLELTLNQMCSMVEKMLETPDARGD